MSTTGSSSRLKVARSPAAHEAASPRGLAVLELGERRAIEVERLEALEVPGRGGRPDLVEALADLRLSVGGGLG